MQDNRNYANRTLFWGDNIDFMRAMNSETVDLIATDPPFNKGRDFHATPDSLAAGASFQDRWKWDEESHPQFTNALRDDPKNANIWWVIKSARASWGDDMGAFLCFMGVRLMEMRRVLKPTGSIYLHCDPTASHYLKALMDAVFGRENFRNEIVWYYKNASRGKKQRAKAHDIVLLYAKDGEGIFNRENVLIPYESGMTAWRYKKAGKEPPKGKTPDDVIVMPSLNTMDKERTGYPTQKPLALYKNFIEASSNPGDIVLDPFAGCATTCVAAEQLGRQWVGIDLWKETKDLTVARLNAEKRIFAVEQMTVTQTPPERTDDGEVASPDLRLKMQRQLAKWQRLYRHEIFDYLADAQVTPAGLITCAGCGRSHEYEYMQLDHIRAKDDGGEDYITNRVLLCGPCNRWKSNIYGLAGLRRANKKRKDKRGKVWMQDEEAARSAQDRARWKAEEVREALS